MKMINNKNNIKSLLFPILIIILSCLFYRTLITDKPFFGEVYIYSFFSFIRDNLKDFIIPFWNPYIQCGQPTLANPPIYGVFYPINLIFDFLPINTNIAININALLHIILGELFFYYLIYFYTKNRVYSFFGCLIFISSFFITSQLKSGYNLVLNSLIWFPLIMLFSEKYFRYKLKRYLFLTGFAFSMQLLGGSTQHFLYSFAIIYLRFIYQIYIENNYKLSNIISKHTDIFIIGISAILISSPQVLPMLYYIFNSPRANWPLYKNMIGSMNPSELMTVFLPPTNFIGLFTSLFVVLSIIYRKKDKLILFWILTFFVCIVYAFGMYSPIFYIIHAFPMFNVLRRSSRILPFASISITILSCMGMTYFFDSTTDIFVSLKRKIIKIYKYIIIIIIVFILYGLLCSLFIENIDYIYLAVVKPIVRIPFLENPWVIGRINSIFYHAAINSISYLYSKIFIFYMVIFILELILFSILIKYKKINKKTLILLFIGEILLSLIIIKDKIYFTNPDTFYLKGPIKQYLINNKDNCRVLSLKEKSEYSTKYYMRDQGMQDKVEALSAVATYISPGYLDFVIEVLNKKNAQKDFKEVELTNPESPFEPHLDLLAVKYIVDNKNIESFEKIIEDKNGIKLYVRNKDLNPYYIAYDYKIFYERKDLIKAMIDDQNIYNKKVYIFNPETPIPDLTPGKNKTSKFYRQNVNNIDIICETTSKGILVVSENYDKGWRLTIDGKHQTILKANLCFMGVVLEKGKHHVHLEYSPINILTNLLNKK